MHSTPFPLLQRLPPAGGGGGGGGGGGRQVWGHEGCIITTALLQSVGFLATHRSGQTSK